jgi:hypothetical protein
MHLRGLLFVSGGVCSQSSSNRPITSMMSGWMCSPSAWCWQKSCHAFLPILIRECLAPLSSSAANLLLVQSCTHGDLIEKLTSLTQPPNLLVGLDCKAFHKRFGKSGYPQSLLTILQECVDMEPAERPLFPNIQRALSKLLAKKRSQWWAESAASDTSAVLDSAAPTLAPAAAMEEPPAPAVTATGPTLPQTASASSLAAAGRGMSSVV